MDLLLVHGTEALAATEQAQEEFFHLYEALKRRGSRIMLAADRPPSEIAIDERLRSRFEGGLVLDLEVKKVPKDAGEIVLVEVGQEAVPKPSEEDIWAGTAGGAAVPEDPPIPEDGGIIPPLEELIGERGGAPYRPGRAGARAVDRCGGACA